MNLIGFSAFDDELAAQLKTLLDEKAITAKMYRSVKGLAARLRKSRHDIQGLLILTRTVEELDDILALQDLLTDVPIILIVPDTRRETLSKGHCLRPRFLGVLEQGALGDIPGVLDKLTQKRQDLPY